MLRTVTISHYSFICFQHIEILCNSFSFRFYCEQPEDKWIKTSSQQNIIFKNISNGTIPFILSDCTEPLLHTLKCFHWINNHQLIEVNFYLFESHVCIRVDWQWELSQMLQTLFHMEKTVKGKQFRCKQYPVWTLLVEISLNIIKNVKKITEQPKSIECNVPKKYSHLLPLKKSNAN